MSKVYSNTYYMEVWEKFTRADGEPSWYTMMWGDGYTKIRIGENHRIRTKSDIKKKVDEFLRETHFQIDTFECTEHEYGWTFERFVKYHNDEFKECDVVKKGEHTDHEEYEINIIYIDEVNGMDRLK